jgi:hypothetical protein
MLQTDPMPSDDSVSEDSYAILKSRVAWQRLIEPTMTVSSPMSAQAKGVEHNPNAKGNDTYRD